MARPLAPYLFGAALQLSGQGRWQRTEQVQWTLVRCRADAFKPLPEHSLANSIEAIRKILVTINGQTRVAYARNKPHRTD